MGGRILGSLAAIIFCALYIFAAEPPKIVFKEDFEHGLTDRWKPVKFEGLTLYSVMREGTNSFLQAVADKAASGLATAVSIEPKGRLIFSWRWKIDKTPKSGGETEKKTFDHTARLFVGFKSRLGPPRTINYVWANSTPVGKTFHHPSSGRSRFIVLDSGTAKAGQWITHRRDILADWKTLFEDDDPPEIVGVGLMTDSDGTQTKVVGSYDDLIISKE
jgi:hypothetical protein